MSEAQKTAAAIMSKLTGYAASEARVWTAGSKCRVYFGRKYIEITPSGAVDYDQSDSAYGVLAELLDDTDVTVINVPSYLR